MKNTPIFTALSVVAAFVLFGCTPNTKNTTAAGSGITVAPGSGGNNKIAYVNIDTLEAKYELLKSKREDFKERQEQMESELQRSYQQMQSDADEVQKKAQANTLTQPEYEAAQKRLMQEQQSLETRKQSLTDQLMKEQDEFNKDLKTRLDAFLDEYNKSRNYDYILSYSAAGSSILYANKQFDITKDVVDGMNAEANTEAGKKK